MVKRRSLLPLLPLLPTLLGLVIAASASAQQEARLSAFVDSDRELVLAMQPAFHIRYGCLYPITYRIQLPEGSAGLTAERRHSCLEAWTALPEKTPDDFFNGIEAVRFDYARNRAHVSAAFAGNSDSLFLRIRDSAGDSASIGFEAIDEYYDDRRAVVTVSADDWCNNEDERFCAAMDVFRSYRLYVTGGVITGHDWCSPHTWADIQGEVDSGYLELASHSRTHTSVPYDDPDSEVEGSADDIVHHVQLPAQFSSNGLSYVYVWIAPFGSYDATVDSLVGVRGYLVPRLYNHAGQWSFGDWNEARMHFSPIQPTLEIGSPSWGGGSRDSSLMNESFDEIVGSRGIYHLMWHPQAICDDLNEPYFTSHLSHISGRADLWYGCLGQVYLYHLIEHANQPVVTTLTVPGERRGSSGLRQNFPNPFHPKTTIAFDVAERAHVSVRVFNVFGERVATLVDGARDPGQYLVPWDARKIPAGIYFCRLEVSTGAGRGGMITSTKKMLLVR